MEEFSPAPAPSESKITPKDLMNWGLVIAGGFLVFKVFRGLGLIKTLNEQKIEEREEELEQQVEEGELKDWTKPNFWKQPAPSGFKVVTYSDSKIPAKWAIDMKATKGTFDDDEEKMKGLINQIQYKTQYSFLAYAFFLLTNEDLTAWLKNVYSEDELKAPFDHLNKIPTYKKI